MGFPLESVKSRGVVEVVGGGDIEDVDLVFFEDVHPGGLSVEGDRGCFRDSLRVGGAERLGGLRCPGTDGHKLEGDFGEFPGAFIQPYPAEVGRNSAALEIFNGPKNHVSAKHAPADQGDLELFFVIQHKLKLSIRVNICSTILTKSPVERK